MRLLLLLLAACAREPVGALCDLGSPLPQSGDVVITSNSLDCTTRTCLRVPLRAELPPGSQFPGGTSGLCTAECTTDEDCEGAAGSPCTTGFTCAVAVAAGPACCKKLCICKDYGGLTETAACDAANPDNACCNLDDRANNPQYPLCHG